MCTCTLVVAVVCARYENERSRSSGKTSWTRERRDDARHMSTGMRKFHSKNVYMKKFTPDPSRELNLN